jgi:hypothetical protein
MKKCLISFLMVLIITIMFSITTPALADQPIQIFINNQQLATDVSPVIENGTTLVPIRAIFEGLGCMIGWDASAEIVLATKNGTQYQFKIGSNVYEINSISKVTPTSPKIINGRAMVPLRIVSEAMGYNVSWNGDTQIINITGDGNATTTNTVNNTSLTIAGQEKQELRQFLQDTVDITNESTNAIQNNSSESDLVNIRENALTVIKKLNDWGEINSHYTDTKAILIDLLINDEKLCHAKNMPFKPESLHEAVMTDLANAILNDSVKLSVQVERLKKWGDL